VHSEFVKQCRALGLSAADYPFNTQLLAIRSLSQWLRQALLESFHLAARAAGASHLKGLPKPPSQRSAAIRPFQVVEFDAHRLDIRLKVVVRDPLGFEHEFEIERVWLLAIIDVCTRAVLGYHLSLGREYNRYDVIKTVERALEPHRAWQFTIPGLGYGPHGGFPSQRLPELSYATWEWIRLDNAKANLAQETLTALCEFVACFADAGPHYSPDERPYIERLFGTLASSLSSRLPGYTGSHPKDLRRALSDPKGDLRLYVSLDELEDLIEYAIASYNGTPHSGLSERTPLEAMEYFVRGKYPPLHWLAEPRRRTLCLMQSARRCTVRGYLNGGTRPHINLYGVRYTSEVLARSTPLLGTKLLIYLNAEDMRSVRAFLPDGAELGVLTAQGAWGVVAHNVKLRQQILKLRNTKGMPAAIDQSVIEEFVQSKLSQAKKKRKAASELSEALRILANAPTLRTPPGPPRAQAPAAASAPQKDAPAGTAAAATRPVCPRKLSIGTGHTF